MKRFLSGIVLAAICGPLQAQIDDMYLGDGAEPSITFNRAAVPDDARVVVAFIRWTGGAYSGLDYTVSSDGGQSFSTPVQLQLPGAVDPTLTSNWSTGAFYGAWLSVPANIRLQFKMSTPDLSGFESTAQLIKSQDTGETLDRPWIVSNGSQVFASYSRASQQNFQTMIQVKRGAIDQNGSVDWSSPTVQVPDTQLSPYSYIFSAPIAQGSTSQYLYILAVRTLAGTIGPQNIVRLFRSTNGGTSWTFNDMLYDVKLYYSDNAGFYDARDRKMAAHSISGDPNSLNVYTFYVKTKNFKAPPDDQFGGLDKRYQALYVKRSIDNGATWKAEKQIYSLPINQWPSRWATIPADPTSNADGFYRIGRVWSSVSPNGTVHVVWYDNRGGYAESRFDPEAQLRELDKWTLHRAVSKDYGATWSVKSNIFTNPSLGGVGVPGAGLYEKYWVPPGDTLGVDASDAKLYIVAPDSSTYLTDASDKPQILYEVVLRGDW